MATNGAYIVHTSETVVISEIGKFNYYPYHSWQHINAWLSLFDEKITMFFEFLVC